MCNKENIKLLNTAQLLVKKKNMLRKISYHVLRYKNVQINHKAAIKTYGNKYNYLCDRGRPEEILAGGVFP